MIPLLVVVGILDPHGLVDAPQLDLAMPDRACSRFKNLTNAHPFLAFSEAPCFFLIMDGIRSWIPEHARGRAWAEACP